MAARWQKANCWIALIQREDFSSVFGVLNRQLLHSVIAQTLTPMGSIDLFTAPGFKVYLFTDHAMRRCGDATALLGPGSFQ
jgi:hypothetical protein